MEGKPRPCCIDHSGYPASSQPSTPQPIPPAPRRIRLLIPPTSCSPLHILPSTSRFTPAILVYRTFSHPPLFAIYRFEIPLKTAKTQAVVVRSALIPPMALDITISPAVYSLIGIRDSTYRQTWNGGIGVNAPPPAPFVFKDLHLAIAKNLSSSPCLSGVSGAVPFP